MFTVQFSSGSQTFSNTVPLIKSCSAHTTHFWVKNHLDQIEGWPAACTRKGYA